MKQAFERKLGVVFGFSLTILFVIGVFQCQTINKLVAANQGVVQTQETLEKLAVTQCLVNDALAGTRDYMTTGDGSYLQPYRAATSGVPLALQNLKRLTAGNPGQQKKLAALGSLTMTELADLQKIIEARGPRRISGGTQPSPVGTSPKAMEDFRQAIRGMEDEERGRLHQRIAAARATARAATLMTTEAAAVGFWLLVIAGLVIRHYVVERRRNKTAGLLSAQLLENMIGAVYLSDETGMILYANPAAEAMFGYKPGELVGENINLLNDFPSTKESGSLFDQIHDQLRGCGTWKGELACRKKGDTRLACYARISALEAFGKVHWISVVEDIPERQPAEAWRAPARGPIEEYARAS